MVNVPLVSVIIVNWNGMKYLETCLTTLYNQTFRDFEVLLIDNASTDNSVTFVRERFREVKVYQNKKNLGITIGNNIGINKSLGKYIFILNNDTELEPHCLESLVEIAELYPDVGMIATKIKFTFDKSRIHSIGHLAYLDGINRCKGYLEQDVGQFDERKEVLSASCVAALYRKDVLQEIGLFDEDFFIYGEDFDLGMRVRLAGWRCLYVPEAVVYHVYSGTMGKYSPQKAFYVERNRIWVALKYFPLSMLLVTPYYTVIRYLYTVYGILIRKGPSGKFVEEYSPLKLFLVLICA